jgi:lipid A disaccharide synthetase
MTKSFTRESYITKKRNIIAFSAIAIVCIPTIAIFCIILLKMYILRNLTYKNYVVLHNVFSDEEIHNIQDCIDDVNKLAKYQKLILSKIQTRLNVKYMKAGLARYSDNNNNDAQAYYYFLFLIFLISQFFANGD